MKKSDKKHRKDDDMDKDIKSAIACFGTLGDRFRTSSGRLSPIS